MAKTQELPTFTSSELMALFHAANEVEAGGFEGPPWDEHATACNALLSAICKLRLWHSERGGTGGCRTGRSTNSSTASVSMNLVEGLLAEMNRVRDVKKIYEEVGPIGMFAVGQMTLSLAAAEKAMGTGDLVAMMAVYKDLQRYTE